MKYFYTFNEHTLCYIETNPSLEKTILFIHGFPEDLSAWTFFTNHTELRDFNCIAIDLPGFGESSPINIKNLTLPNISSLIISFLNSKKLQNIQVIGHDWGGIIAWYLLSNNPSYFNRAIILNCPHYNSFKFSLLLNPLQLFKSWYIFFFQIPYLPDFLLRLNNYFLIKKFTNANPQNITTMLAWYRAMKNMLFHKSIVISVPILLIAGKKDPFIMPSTISKSKEFCTTCKFIEFKEGRHFFHHEYPELLLGYIKG